MTSDSLLQRLVFAMLIYCFIMIIIIASSSTSSLRTYNRKKEYIVRAVLLFLSTLLLRTSENFEDEKLFLTDYDVKFLIY
jgi:hypothetical protein